MLKRFFARNRQVLTYTDPNLSVFWTRDPEIVNLKAPNPEKAHVSIGQPYNELALHSIWRSTLAAR